MKKPIGWSILVIVVIAVLSLATAKTSGSWTPAVFLLLFAGFWLLVWRHLYACRIAPDTERLIVEVNEPITMLNIKTFLYETIQPGKYALKPAPSPFQRPETYWCVENKALASMVGGTEKKWRESEFVEVIE